MMRHHSEHQPEPRPSRNLTLTAQQTPSEVSRNALDLPRILGHRAADLTIKLGSIASSVMLILIAPLGAPRVAYGAPVYLHLDSPYPSGHHGRKLLEDRTKKIQLQRWFRVETNGKASGWVNEDHLVTSLKLASEAIVKDTTPLRTDRQLDAIQKHIVNKGARVKVIEVRGSWTMIRTPLASGELHDAWVLNEALRPITDSGQLNSDNQRLFIPFEAELHVEPRRQSRVSTTISRMSFATLLGKAKAGPDHSEWFEVRTKFGSGFLERRDFVTAADLGTGGAYPLRDWVPVRSAPLPFAHIARTLSPGARTARPHPLKLTDSQTLRWGQVRLPENGELWWPITDAREDFGDDEADPLPRERLSSDELFSRAIFDMAASPAIPSLKIASASGVYRSIDGKDWVKIPLFENKNYPIAITALGTIFVGPYMSDDHGESFRQWIRWDTLVATLRKTSRVTLNELKLQEIRLEDPSGRRVALKVTVGNQVPLKILTDDQGRTWRPL